MRILYIAFDNPATENIIGGMNDDTLAGLPALYYPFKLLLERGHSVDLLLFSPDKDKHFVESEHFKKENFFHVALPSDSGIKGKLNFIKTVSGETKRRLKTRKYDFVYGLAEGAILGVMEAQKMKIPCGYRQFGIYNDFEKSVRKRKTLIGKRITAFMRHTYVYLAMRAKMDFLLTTNDGSHQDILFDMLKIKKRFKFFFWRSGIKMPKEKPKPDALDMESIVQISRFSPEKRQPRSATILGIIHKRGYNLHLHYVGDDSDSAVKNAIISEAEKWGVREYVHFEGRQPQASVWKFARNSLACIMPNESGLVNVFYENLAQGAAVIAAKTSTLDEYIVNGKNGYQFETEEEAADYIEQLINNSELYSKLRENAYITATEKVISIDERFGMEVDLIEDAANRRSMEKYPERL